MAVPDGESVRDAESVSLMHVGDPGSSTPSHPTTEAKNSARMEVDNSARMGVDTPSEATKTGVAHLTASPVNFNEDSHDKDDGSGDVGKVSHLRTGARQRNRLEKLHDDTAALDDDEGDYNDGTNTGK